jgi:hypothetical protein
MAELVYEGGGQQYTLRASGPMPIYAGQAPGNIPDSYVIHSFGADLSTIDIYECTETLLASTEFQGQGGNLTSASFSSVGDREGKVFQGRAVYYPEFITESQLGFNTLLYSCVGRSL